MTEMAAKGKENCSSMNRPPAGPSRAKMLSSQRESLSGLARPLHCRNQAGPLGLGALQPKLVVGPADDEYEREADRVAEQAVSMQQPPVQRACPSCEEDERAQREPLAARITPLVQRKVGEEDEEKLQTSPMVQKQEAEEEEEEKLQASPMVQRQAAKEEEEEKLQAAPEGLGSKGGPAGPELEQSLEQARAGGRPLAERFRGRMENAFGADFSSVRIHADEPADRLSRSIQARAFTRGHDIFLRQGEYQPASAEGQRLLAHELTHVVQQSQDLLPHSCADLMNDGQNKSIFKRSMAREIYLMKPHIQSAKSIRRVIDDIQPPRISPADRIGVPIDIVVTFSSQDPNRIYVKRKAKAVQFIKGHIIPSESDYSATNGTVLADDEFEEIPKFNDADSKWVGSANTTLSIDHAQWVDDGPRQQHIRRSNSTIDVDDKPGLARGANYFPSSFYAKFKFSAVEVDESGKPNLNSRKDKEYEAGYSVDEKGDVSNNADANLFTGHPSIEQPEKTNIKRRNEEYERRFRGSERGKLPKGRKRSDSQ